MPPARQFIAFVGMTQIISDVVREKGDVLQSYKTDVEVEEFERKQVRDALRGRRRARARSCPLHPPLTPPSLSPLVRVSRHALPHTWHATSRRAPSSRLSPPPLVLRPTAALGASAGQEGRGDSPRDGYMTVT